MTGLELLAYWNKEYNFNEKKIRQLILDNIVNAPVKRVYKKSNNEINEVWQEFNNIYKS